MSCVLICACALIAIVLRAVWEQNSTEKSGEEQVNFCVYHYFRLK